MSVKLDGWTKIGDKTAPTGKWTVYKFRGKEFDEVEVLDKFDDEPAATDAFFRARDALKRGAAWLVAPDGTVKDLKFVRPF